MRIKRRVRRLRSAEERRAWARADLAGEGVALAALSLLQRLFLLREFLLEGRLPGQELL